ncbi:MAG: hypothetical protein QM813_09305 [Verrucomicrobiota bacterium]
MGQDSYSQSTSESASQAVQLDMSGFNVGGGLKIPSWVWIIVAALGGAWVIKKLFFSN